MPGLKQTLCCFFAETWIQGTSNLHQVKSWTIPPRLKTESWLELINWTQTVCQAHHKRKYAACGIFVSVLGLRFVCIAEAPENNVECNLAAKVWELLLAKTMRLPTGSSSFSPLKCLKGGTRYPTRSLRKVWRKIHRWLLKKGYSRAEISFWLFLFRKSGYLVWEMREETDWAFSLINYWATKIPECRVHHPNEILIFAT